METAKINVLSLFDGMSCGQIALDQSGIEVDKYYASEIDKYAIEITKKNYPNTMHVSNSQRYKMIGNGWTVAIIKHIFRGIKNETY